LSIGSDERDIAEEYGDLPGAPLPLGFGLQQAQDARHAAAGVLPDGRRRQCGLRRWGGRRVIVTDVTSWLLSGRPSSFRSA
jgi:hypothetical protein